MGLPEYPCVRRQFHLIKMGEDRVQVRGPLRTVVLNGQGKASQLINLLTLLDGQHTLTDIATLQDDYGQAEVSKLVAHLQNVGLLEADHEELSTQYEHQRVLWSQLRFGETGTTLQKRLESARVMLIGIGAIGSATAVSLLAAGIQCLHIADWQTITPVDLGWVYQSGDIGRQRTTVAMERWQEMYDSADLHSHTQKLDSPQSYQDLLTRVEVDLVLLCQNTFQPKWAEWLNEASLATHTRWVPAWLEGPIGYVGPAVVPHQTACFQCYQIRRHEAVDNLEELIAFENYVSEQEEPQVKYGLIPALAGTIANLLAWEALKILTNNLYATTYSQLLEFDFRTIETTAHKVWKYPHCLSCGRPNRFPAIQAWEGGLEQ